MEGRAKIIFSGKVMMNKINFNWELLLSIPKMSMKIQNNAMMKFKILATRPKLIASKITIIPDNNEKKINLQDLHAIFIIIT